MSATEGQGGPGKAMRFERFLARLVLEDKSVGLLALADHSAVLILDDGSQALVFRYLPEAHDSIAAHLKQMISGLRSGQLHVVAIGGGKPVEEILRQAQPRIMLTRHVTLLQWTDEGRAWVGPHTSKRHLLARCLKDMAGRKDPGSFRDPREGLQAAVDPESRRGREVIEFAQRLKGARPRVTIGLAAACGVMFLLSNVWGGSDYSPTLVRMGANVPSLVAAGEIHRLLSSVFLHAGFTHMLMNGLAVYMLGEFMERLLGAPRMLILFLVAGMGGSLGSATLSGASLSVGASGALWGLFGAAAVLSFAPWGGIPRPVQLRLRRNVMALLAINLVISFLPRVDLWAHLGGGLAGALLISTRVLSTRSEQGGASRILKAIAVAAGGLAVTACLLAVIQGRPWTLVEEPNTKQVELGSSGVTLQVPRIVADERQEARDGDVVEFAFGQLGPDPIMVVITLVPGPSDLGDPERFQTELEALRTARESQEVARAQRSGTLHTRVIGGVQTLEELFVYPGGARHWRFSQIRPGLVLTVVVLVFPEGPQAWHQQNDRILKSIKTDRPLRTRA